MAVWVGASIFAAACRPEDICAGTLITLLAALNGGITTVIDKMHHARSPEHSDAGRRGTTGVRRARRARDGPPALGRLGRDNNCGVGDLAGSLTPGPASAIPARRRSCPDRSPTGPSPWNPGREHNPDLLLTAGKPTSSWISDQPPDSARRETSSRGGHDDAVLVEGRWLHRTALSRAEGWRVAP